MIRSWIVMPLLCALSFVCCSNGDDDGSSGGGKKPAMSLVIESSDGESVTLGIKWLNATHVRVVCMATEDKKALTGAEVAAQGTKYAEERVTIGGLTPMTTYTVFAVACDDAGGYSGMQVVQFVTEYAGPRPYEWKSARDGIPSYTDLVLCYGGSTHRTPFGWDKERFAPFVTYTDEAGGEHWLFDSFLCIEFVMVPYSINLGQKRTSGGREQWQELIDYWFGPDNGVNALEEAVGEAAARLGAPAGKRKVVMVMPDPIIYEEYADTNTSTTYWGELNGRRLDFAKASDRIAAYKWYIDSVRRLFDEADYRYVELAGFYIVSEDLATPGDGWNPELKRWEEVIPEVAEYLHALNESLCWIPYNRAAGYRNWKRFGIDYAYMQPNYFWDDKGEKPLSRFFSDIKANDLAMEFEFDDALLEKTAGSEVYRRRLREYMDGAKEHGIYGRKPLAYYHGQNTLYELSVSAAAEDRKLYHEFCRFVLDNPLRK